MGCEDYTWFDTYTTSSLDLTVELIAYTITGFLSEGFSILNLLAWKQTPVGETEEINSYFEDLTFIATDSLIEVFAALAKIYFSTIGL